MIKLFNFTPTMEDYFRLVSEELLNKLNQIRQFIKKHNPTIGYITEEILRNFLKTYLPKSVSVEQGFIISSEGIISKQCDIIIYDSLRFAPIYRLNNIVIVPADAVILIIEVKTTLTKQIFHNAIDYFNSTRKLCLAKSYLFIYHSCEISKLENYLKTYKHKRDKQNLDLPFPFEENEEVYTGLDHDTFQFLPDEITGINNSYHLQKALVTIFDRDSMGYESWFFENENGTEISALENFYLSVYKTIADYNIKMGLNQFKKEKVSYIGKRNLKSFFAIELFDM